MNRQNTLHLFLKSVWYDKIASGEKTSGHVSKYYLDEQKVVKTEYH